MTFESSNRKMLEGMATEQVVETVRIAMAVGCISPCHVYDAVDELICRLCKAEGIVEERPPLRGGKEKDDETTVVSRR